MRTPLLPILILIAIGIAIDCYLYRRMRSAHVGRGWLWAYIALAGVASAALLMVDLWPKKQGSDHTILILMWTIFAYATVYVPKYIAAIPALIGQVVMKLNRGVGRIFNYLALGCAAAVFIALWWGALFTRFQVQVNTEEIAAAGLPPAFDGYRIVQISDLHTGTFGDDPRLISRLVDSVNAQRPDLIVFTGDIVNRHSTELLPFTSLLGQLSAPDGVLSIMGNHDYGDYYKWEDEASKQADIDNLRSMQRHMGWRMLNNESAVIRRGCDSLVVIGVENIGDPPFAVYGSLSQAYANTADRAAKILLTHNPAHWCDSIANHADRNIALTLSGHTHAMQLEVLGRSPAAWRYKTWGGLYTDTLGRNLYVNIGAGEVGFPARIGAKPEVSVLILKTKQ